MSSPENINKEDLKAFRQLFDQVKVDYGYTTFEKCRNVNVGLYNPKGNIVNLIPSHINYNETELQELSSIDISNLLNPKNKNTKSNSNEIFKSNIFISTHQLITKLKSQAWYQKVINPPLDFISNNENIIKIALESIHDISELLTRIYDKNRKLSFFDYLYFGLSIREYSFKFIDTLKALSDSLQREESKNSFKNLVKFASLADYFSIELLLKIKDNIAIKVEKSEKFNTFNLVNKEKKLVVYSVMFNNNLELFYLFNDNNLQFVFTTSVDQFEIINTLISNYIWNTSFPGCNKLELYKDNQYRPFDLEKDNKFIYTQSYQQYLTDLIYYLSNNINRSLLVYGPPGSGKTTLLSYLVNNLNLKTIKINLEIFKDDIAPLNKILDIIKPEIIVFEDLDHLQIHALSSFLELLQHLNKTTKLILATANQVSILNPAFQRPERFDQLIEINKLDKEVILTLVEQDLEIFEFVKNFPIVYITETMKRVKAKGKEKALKESQDILNRIANLDKFNYTSLKNQNEIDLS